MSKNVEYCVYFTGRDNLGVVKTTRNTFSSDSAAYEHAVGLGRNLKRESYLAIVACKEWQHKNGRLIRELLVSYTGKQTRSNKKQ